MRQFTLRVRPAPPTAASALPARSALFALALVFAGATSACGTRARSDGQATASPGASAGPASHGSAIRAAASGSAGAKAPSTGKEFVAPKVKAPTRDEARALWKTALAAALKKDCELAVDANAQAGLMYGHLEQTLADIKQNAEAYVALGHCAEKVHAYHTMLKLGLLLQQADPKLHPEILARAYLGLGGSGDVAEAIKVLLKAARANPKDADVALTLAKAECHYQKWDDCTRVADATLKIVGDPSTPEKKEVAWRAHKYKARAFLHTAAKLDEAASEVDLAEKLGAPTDELDLVKKAASSAKRHKILAEPEFGKDIPLGAYHLFGKIAEIGDVVDVNVFNADKKDHEIKVEAEITGTTEKVTKTLTVLAGKSDHVALNPPLKTSWDINSVSADTPAQLAIKITRDGADEVLDQTFPVTLLPRDTLPFGRFLDRDRTVYRSTPALIAAWVTPNDKAVEELLAAAKKRLPAGFSMSGGQRPTPPQVQAVYDELHARGMSYVMDPALFVEGKAAQRTRLPRHVLASTNAQCVEGAILYASVMEAIGLHPVITLVPGHSFVGWHAEGHDDPPAGPSKIDAIAGLFFVETTMTHNSPFDVALKTGMREAYEDHEKEWTVSIGYGHTMSEVVDISSLRKQGVTPQPWR